MKNEKIIEEIEVPALTRIMLAPEETVFAQCSRFTRSNLGKLSQVLAFTVPVCGFILGASLTKFCFGGNPASYFLTVPLGMLIYWYLDRLIVMADARVNAKFIKYTRIAISIIFGLFNSFLIDSGMYSADIKAEVQKETVVEQTVVQAETDSLANIHQVHKEHVYSQIKAGEAHLQERNNELVAEVEGSAFSHHVGRGVVYDEKREALERESADFAREKALLLVEAAKDDSAIAQIDREGAKKKAGVPEHISHGFNHNMELLHIVIFRKPFNIFVAFLFLCISMVLELLPMLAKHYIDISEYFEHAQHHVDAHIAASVMNKQQLIDQQGYNLQLANERAMQVAHGQHALELFQQKSSHHERILEAVDSHFETITQKQADMKSRYPEHFEKHLKAVFDRIFNIFHENQAAASNLITSQEETTKNQ